MEKYIVEPLDVDNYATWSVRIKMLLVQKGVWGAVVPTEAAAVSKADDMKALSLIGLHVKDHHLQSIDACQSAQQAWELLANTYKGKSQARQLQLRRELNSIKMGPGEALTVYFARGQALAADLVSAGHTIGSTEIAYALLAGLPAAFDMAVTVLETSGQHMDVQSLLPRLLPIEQRLRSQQSIDSAAFTARQSRVQYGNNNSGSSQKPSGKHYQRTCFRCGQPGRLAAQCHRADGKQCNICGRMGHLAKACRSKQGGKQQVAFMAMNKGADDSWVLDSGCSSHLTAQRGVFSSYEQLCSPVYITFGNGQRAAAVGRGSVPLDVGDTQVTLLTVLHVPEAHVNLISIQKVVESGARVEFCDGTCYIRKQGKLVLQAQQRDGLYSLHCHNSRIPIGETAFASSRGTETAQLWHERFGHLNYGGLAQVVSMVDGISVPSSEFIEAGKVLCEPCVQAKQPRAPFPISTSESTRPLQLVHMDLCGPLPVQSLGGSHYFATFLDDYSRFSLVVPVSSKADVPAVVKRTIKLLETQCGQQLQAVRTDRGGEYLNRELASYFESRGVQHQTTVPYTPEQNGAAERLNRTLMERVRAMLLGSRLHQEFWAEAVVTANYIRNRSPTSKETKTPWERFTGKRADVSGMRVFGTRAFVLTPKQLRRKLDPVSQPGVMVGYAVNSKGYRILLDNSNKIVESRDVVFNEASKPWDSTSTVTAGLRNIVLSDSEEEEQQGTAPQQGQDDSRNEDMEAKQSQGEQQEHSRTPSMENVGEQDASAAQPSRYPVRARRPPGQWYAANVATVNDEPATVEQALSRPDADMWRHAMDEEMTSLLANETW